MLKRYSISPLWPSRTSEQIDSRERMLQTNYWWLDHTPREIWSDFENKELNYEDPCYFVQGKRDPPGDSPLLWEDSIRRRGSEFVLCYIWECDGLRGEEGKDENVGIYCELGFVDKNNNWDTFWEEVSSSQLAPFLLTVC